MNVLVYKAVSQNNVLTEMSSSLTQALGEVGIEATLLALAGADWPQTVVQTVRDRKIDYVATFGSFSADLMTADGRPIFDALGCGFVGWDVDHPAYQFKRFTTPIRRRVQVCASPSHVRFARLMGCEAAECVMLPGVDVVAAEPLPLEERPIPFMVAMSWLGEPTVWWSGAKGTAGYNLIEGVVGRLLADPEADLFAAYQATLADTGLDLRLDENLCNVMANIGLFIRQHDRQQLAKALAEMDLPCLLCGTGWRERLGELAHITFSDSLGFSGVAELYAKSRVVLNLNAANGASERAISAMAAGAVVVSDDSPLLRSEFPDGGINFFDRRNPASIAETVSSLLASSKAQAMADRGRERVAQGQRWRHKASRLADTLSGLDTGSMRLAG